MLRGLDGAIDVIVPRGGKSLVSRVQDEARVPVFAHLEGICHVYWDRGADIDDALPIIINAKLRRTGICGAAETLLVDSEAPAAHLAAAVKGLLDAGCEVRGDTSVRNADPRVTPATEEELVNGISGQDHFRKGCRRRRRCHRPHRQVWLTTHRLHFDGMLRHRRDFSKACRLGDCPAQCLDPVR